MSVPGLSTGGGDMALGDSDQSSQTSGNIGGSSADRISKQFINISGGNDLDLNSFLGASNSSFYNAIAGEQKLETGMPNPNNGAFKYAALGAGVLVALIAVIALKGRK